MPVGRVGVSPFVCKVRTASGTTAVQIVSKSGGVCWIVEHLGSAHDEPEPEVLREAMGEKCLRAPGRNQAERGHAS